MSTPLIGEKILLIGCSRGLGQELTDLVLAKGASVYGVSRKLSHESLQRWNSSGNFEHQSVDVTQIDWLDKLMAKVDCKKFDRAYFLVGGGPYGEFSAKSLKDHHWAYRASFLAASELLHAALSETWPVKQLLFIGSEVADAKIDINAASYCAAKHALRGLIETVQAELELSQNQLDLRFYRPPYMPTDLLPRNSAPRLEDKAVSTRLVAEDLIQWLISPRSNSKLKSYSS